MNHNLSKINPWQEQHVSSTSLFRKSSLDQALSKIAAAGFRWVEIWGNEAHLDPRLNPDVPAVRSLLEELGLQVHAIHTPYSGLRLGHPKAGLQESWLQVVGASLAIGAEVGTQIAVVHLTSDPAGLNDEMYDQSKEMAIAYIEALSQQAKELDIKLAVENLPLRPNLKRRFGSSLKELSEAFPDQDIGFCLDVGHVAINGLDLRSEIEAAGERLVSIHAANNDGMKDRHWLPTRGMLDWKEVKRELVRGGYMGRYVLEVLRNPEGDDPDPVLRQIVEFAKGDTG